MVGRDGHESSESLRNGMEALIETFSKTKSQDKEN